MANENKVFLLLPDLGDDVMTLFYQILLGLVLLIRDQLLHLIPVAHGPVKQTMLTPDQLKGIKCILMLKNDHSTKMSV